MAASRFDEAERMLSRLLARHPDRIDVRLSYAFCAHNSGRYEDALARWQDVRARWPDHAFAWTAAAANARELGRLEEARGIIAAALVRFPDDLIAMSEAVRVHDRSGEPLRGLELAAAMARVDPCNAEWDRQLFDRLLAAGRLDEAADRSTLTTLTDAEAALRRARIALRRGQSDEARRLLRATTERGIESNVAEEMRRVATDLKLHHPQESLVLWRHLLHLAPEDALLRHHHIDTLVRCGEYVEAEALARAALADDAGDENLLFDLALVAYKTERWDEAVNAFESLLARRPDHDDAKHYRSRALMDRELARAERANASFAAERQDVGLCEDEDVRRLLLGFESIGQDCEFGLVQRRYGAEPLGLLRWNFTTPATLREALDAGLTGLGDPECTVMQLWDDYEYYLADRRWGFAFHTWISRHEVEPDVLFGKMCRRVAFLRDKLLSDLAAGEKVFVLKTFSATTADVRALYASLQAHGPVRLLWVRSRAMGAPDAAEALPVRNVREVEPGLYAGEVTRFGNRDVGLWSIDFEEWVDLCRAVAGALGSTPASPDT